MVSSAVTSEFGHQNGPLDPRLLLMTRLAPPQQQTRLLTRRQIDELLALALDHPLTLVVAPAGSGKTTALSSFVSRGGWPSGWCRMTGNDDAASLLRHLAACWRPVAPVDEERIDAELRKNSSPLAVLDLLVNELAVRLADETLLVLEDYHLIDAQPELGAIIERLITSLPLRLHLLLSTRYEPTLEALTTARARGELYRVTQANLAFTSDETRALFALYERPAPEHVEELTMLCRGWPLAIQALAQQAGTATPADLRQDPLPLIDEYLTRQVLDAQPTGVQEFLLLTAGLRWMDETTCSAMPILQQLEVQPTLLQRRCLFVETAEPQDSAFGDGVRLVYQPVFRSFLDRTATLRQSDRRTLHLEAATFYQSSGDLAGVVHHLLQAGDEERAAEVLARTARGWLREGRATTVLSFLNELSEQTRVQPPMLAIAAAAYRRQGRFEKALRLYQQAEQAFEQQGNSIGRVRALRGQAEVYIDTVQPAPAVALLKQALKLLPPDQRVERAELLRLQAENWTNHGRADVALRLQACADRIAAEAAQAAQDQDAILAEQAPPSLPPRMLLRSGRLVEARNLLEQALPSIPSLTPDGHREPPLLLAFVYALLGNSARALALARRGVIEAHQSGSKITEAIANMRAGHACQVITPLDATAANRHYLQALALAQDAGVARTRAEAYLGLALLHGHAGDIAAAEAATKEGLELAQLAGDRWMSALLWLALGAAGVVVSVEQAIGWLEQAHQHFMRGNDQYGQAMVHLWMAIWHIQHSQEQEARSHVDMLITAARRYGYDGPLTGPSLFGPRDLTMLVPVLLRARALPAHSSYAQQLLRQAFPAIASDDAIGEYHPGYTLRIQMMGGFRVWRGMREIRSREWQREKARQLLQLLLTWRGQWIQREQICAWLWPDNDLEAAEKQFKVTLNALNAALEPLRPPRVEPFFIRRQGLAYSFAPSYGCWIDVDEFELRVSAGGVLQGDQETALRNLQIAVQLYRGDYLAESLYDPWTIEERERLLARYLATTTSLAGQLMQRGELLQAIQLCELVIQRDRCYEEAYQVLMQAHARNGSRSQALRTYARCTRALQEELDIEPLPETILLYEQIKRNETGGHD